MDASFAPPMRVVPANRATPASELLEDLLTAFPEEKVTVGELLQRLESRALGLLLLIFALPMCIPLPPGTSTIFGFLLIAPGLQLLFGRGKMWMPKSVARITVPRESLAKTVSVAAPILRRIEALLRPRICFLTAPPFTAFFGVQVLVMAFVLVLPIPAGNFPPGLSTVILALGLLQRDGVAAILSTAVAGASVAVAFAAAKIVTGFLQGLWGFLPF